MSTDDDATMFMECLGAILELMLHPNVPTGKSRISICSSGLLTHR